MTKIPTSAFELKTGVQLYWRADHKTYTNANLTDKAALAMLDAHPDWLRHFSKIPKDMADAIAKHADTKPVTKSEAPKAETKGEATKAPAAATKPAAKKSHHPKKK